MADDEWDQLPGDWPEQALAYATAPARGVGGPLTGIRPRPAQTASSEGPSGSQNAGRLTAWPATLLRPDAGADAARFHLQASGQPQRPGRCLVTSPISPRLLSVAASIEVPLSWIRNAARLGDPDPANDLLYQLHTLDPADRRPAIWMADHVAPRDPHAAAFLLYAMQRVSPGG